MVVVDVPTRPPPGAEIPMYRILLKLVRCIGVLALSLLSSNQLRAQVASATLSGTITDATGKSMETRTDSAGLYNLLNLVPGDYAVSVSAEGFSTKVAKVTISQGAQQT